MDKYEVLFKDKNFRISKEEITNANIVKLSASKYHILHNNKSIEAELTKVNLLESTIEFKVNESRYLFQIKNELAQTISKLGYSNKSSNVEKTVKAPMPGIVGKIEIGIGEVVIKGQNLLTLEAMKMENIIKASTDGVIQKILVSTKDKVEKNQDLIILE